MNEAHEKSSAMHDAPGDAGDLRTTLWKSAAEFGPSVVLTLASFWVSGTGAVWPQGMRVLLAHPAFFLHVSSGPEGTNNILALAFGVFIVVFGSIVIMANRCGLRPSTRGRSDQPELARSDRRWIAIHRRINA